ncbi:MAG: Mrp/NBP35 family ATP-binding protein [Thermodesulfobacteriota bacterium]|nr:Mrp/NBP35 family ATP-binding protein [Thermodesulfobacteriota bacterium]
MAKKNQTEEQKKHKARMDLQQMEITERLQHINNKIMILSGKGGVGKSSVAAYLSVALARKGYQVGLMDVDLHGPSIPRMLGLQGFVHAGKHEGKMSPLNYFPNMEVISIEILMEDKDSATIWRGPLKGHIIRQFIADVEWGDLDYLIIDSPPGTGDEPLTVAQTVSDAKALIVTTPQEISLADVRKSINFCRKVNMEILGLVENMSGIKCPYCGNIIDLFKTQGGIMTAQKENLKLLATLPFEPELVKKGDEGDTSLFDNNELLITREFNKMVDEIVRLTKVKDQSGDRNEKRMTQAG